MIISKSYRIFAPDEETYGKTNTPFVDHTNRSVGSWIRVCTLHYRPLYHVPSCAPVYISGGDGESAPDSAHDGAAHRQHAERGVDGHAKLSLDCREAPEPSANTGQPQPTVLEREPSRGKLYHRLRAGCLSPIWHLPRGVRLPQPQ